MFVEAGKRGLARFLVINRMDVTIFSSRRCSRESKIASAKPVSCSMPLSVRAQFSGVVSVLNPPEARSLPCCPADIAQARSQMIDCIVESDDSLMEKISDGRHGVRGRIDRRVTEGPGSWLHCSHFVYLGKKDVGVTELLDALARVALSPCRRRNARPSKAVATKRLK